MIPLTKFSAKTLLSIFRFGPLIFYGPIPFSTIIFFRFLFYHIPNHFRLILIDAPSKAWKLIRIANTFPYCAKKIFK